MEWKIVLHISMFCLSHVIRTRNDVSNYRLRAVDPTTHVCEDVCECCWKYVFGKHTRGRLAWLHAMMEIQAVHVAGLTLLAHADDWKNIPGSSSQIQTQQTTNKIQDIHLRELHITIPSKPFMMCLMIWIFISHSLLFACGLFCANVSGGALTLSRYEEC